MRKHASTATRSTPPAALSFRSALAIHKPSSFGRHPPLGGGQMLARPPFSNYLSTLSRPSSPSTIIPEEPNFFPMVGNFFPMVGKSAVVFTGCKKVRTTGQGASPVCARGGLNPSLHIPARGAWWGEASPPSRSCRFSRPPAPFHTGSPGTARPTRGLAIQSRGTKSRGGREEGAQTGDAPNRIPAYAWDLCFRCVEGRRGVDRVRAGALRKRSTRRIMHEGQIHQRA